MVAIVVLLTAVSGEVKIVPFEGAFRFGLGSAVFFFLTLWFPKVSVILSGILVSMFVPIFRISLDALLHMEQFVWLDSLRAHIPVIIYYLLFAVGLHVIRFRDRINHPLLLGLLGAGSDALANVGELLLRKGILHASLQFSEITPILIVGLFRSFFVVGLYSMIHLERLRVRDEEQQKITEKRLGIGTGLYEETLLLKKSMGHIEEVTAKSYELHCTLKEKLTDGEKLQDWKAHLISQSLKVSQEVHDIKKNSQRILAGLLRLFNKESIVEHMTLVEIISFTVKANENYAEMLGKDIRFVTRLLGNNHVMPFYMISSIMNNLLANAVEAIDEQGEIRVTVRDGPEFVEIIVSDSGKGIAPNDYEIIFEPGFTTKFDQTGVAATGIGLSHVRDMVVSELGGEVRVDSSGRRKGALFIVKIPARFGWASEEMSDHAAYISRGG